MLVIIWFSLLTPIMALLHPQLLKDFVARARVNAVLAFHCSDRTLHDLHKILGFESLMMVQSFPLSSENFYVTHRHAMYTGNTRFGVVVDLECSESARLLKFCSQQSYLNASYQWLLISTNQLGFASDLIKDLDVNADARITLGVPNSDDRNYELFEIFGTIHRRSGRIRLISVGMWNNNTGLNRTATTNNYSERKDLGGIRLKSVITTLEAPRNVTLEEYLSSLAPPTRYSADRFGYWMSKMLSIQLNFRFQLVLTKGWSVSLLGKDSTSDVLGQLQNNLVDFSSTPLVLEPDRLNYYEQTVPLVEDKYATLFLHPKNDRSGNMLLQPFQGWVWTLTALFIFLFAVILTVVLIRGRRSEYILNGRLLLTAFEFFCQQGYSGPEVFGSSRVVAITGILFSLIIYQFYMASIYSSLLMDKPKNLRTLEQLLASKLHYAIEENDYNQNYFNTTNKTTDLQLYQEKILPDRFGFVNFSTGIALVKSGKYAFHCDTAYGYTFIRETFSPQEICDIQEIKLFAFRWLHVVVPKGSPLRELFRVSLRRLQEVGVVQYYRNIFYSEKPQCQMMNSEYSQVRFTDIAGLYWVLLGGILCSAILLVGELINDQIKSFLERRKSLHVYHTWLD